MGFPSICTGNQVIEYDHSSSAIDLHQYFQLLLSVTQRCSDKPVVWLTQNSIPSRENRRGYFGNACEPVHFFVFLFILSQYLHVLLGMLQRTSLPQALNLHLWTCWPQVYLVPLWTCASSQQTHKFMIFCDQLISYWVYQMPLIPALQAWVSNSSAFT